MTIQEVKERLRQKKLLRLEQTLKDKGYKEEAIRTVLTNYNNNFNEEPLKTIEPIIEQSFKEEPKEVLRDNALKIYCFNCKVNVEPLEPIFTLKEVKKGSFRNYCKGNCPNCKRVIVGVVKKEVLRGALR